MILLYDSRVNHIIRDFVLLHSSVLQCVAVCCSVLQCVAVCCSVLQALQDILENCVNRLYCMILDSIILFIIMLYVHYHVIHPWLWRRKMQALRCRRTATTHCNVSAATHCNTPGAGICQCVAVCCSVWQCVAVCCSVLQCVAVCCSV